MTDDVVGYWGVLRRLAQPTLAELAREFLQRYGDQAAEYSRNWSWVKDVSDRALAFARRHGDIRAGDAVAIHNGEPIALRRADPPSSDSRPDIYRVRFETLGVTSASDGEVTLEGRGRIDPMLIAEVTRHSEDAIQSSACRIFGAEWSGSACVDTTAYPFLESLMDRHIKMTFKPGEPVEQTDGPAVLVEPRPAIIESVTTRIEADEWATITEHVLEYPRTGVSREMLVSQHRSTVVVVALTADGQLLTVRQWKHGIGRVTVEFPAGYLENELEDPVAAGMRELREETGHISDHWLYLGSFYREPGRGRTALHVCVALECTPASDPEPDDTEEIDAGAASLADVEAMMRDGRMPGLHCLGAWAIARPYVMQPDKEV